MEFTTLTEFDAEIEKLLKKYKILNNDLDVLKSVLSKYPRGYQPVVYRIPNLGVETEIYKVKHFRCKALANKGSHSGRGSAFECVPILELSKRKGLIKEEQAMVLKENLDEICKMLSGLINY